MTTDNLKQIHITTMSGKPEMYIDGLIILDKINSVSVSYTHLTLPTKSDECRSRWSPYH